MSIEFLLTSLIVVTTPGTGVLYVVAAGLSRGARASVIAAVGCTLGIVPHMVADNALRWAVSGGKTAREIAEQLRIKELGGVAGLENIVNPIGAARKGLLQTFESVDEYLQYLDHLIR